MAGPNVKGMVSDPDFQGLSPADKRSALFKLTGDSSFNGLSDAETMQFVQRMGTQAPQTPRTAAFLGNQALSKISPGLAGTRVGQLPNVQMALPGAISRFATAAGATLPSAQPYDPKRSIIAQQIENMNAQGPSALAGQGKELINRFGTGDVAGGLGEIAGIAGQAAVMKKAGEMARAAMPEPQGGGELVPRVNVDKIIGTTPERISELRSFPERVNAARQTVVAAEDAAHQAAKAAFPKFEKPIPTGKMVEVPAEGPTLVDEFGEVRPKALVPETTTFEALQEQRSKLLKQITDEKRAVSRGQQPRFDLADMYEKLRGIDDTMSRAAIEQGGPQGLAQLQAARQQFAKYMQDFHNQGSPLRPLLESKPGETATIIRKLQSPDVGARAIETLRSYGVDTSSIEQMLSRGQKPLAIDVNESAKLRKAGSPEAYKAQRLRESIRQTKVNELPSGAQERVPAKFMRNKWPSVIGDIPGVNAVNPRRVTQFLLERELKKLGQR